MMTDQSKSHFDPEKIKFRGFKFNRFHFRESDSSGKQKGEGFHFKKSLKMGFSPEESLLMADLSIEILEEIDGNEGAFGEFSMWFFYHIENFKEVVKETESEENLEVDDSLAISLASITYSTARGILMTRLCGTSLENAVLPIINPKTLIK